MACTIKLPLTVQERVAIESELVLQLQEAQQMQFNIIINERMAGVLKSIEDQSSDLQQLHMDIAYVNEKVIGLENKTTLIKEPPFTSTPRNATDAPSLLATVHTDMNQKPTIISRGMTTAANPPQNVVNRGMTITADPQSHFGMGATYPISHQQVHQAMPYPDSQQTTQAMPQQTNPVMQAYPPLWNMFTMPPPPLPSTHQVTANQANDGTYVQKQGMSSRGDERKGKDWHHQTRRRDEDHEEDTYDDFDQYEDEYNDDRHGRRGRSWRRRNDSFDQPTKKAKSVAKRMGCGRSKF